MLFWVVFLAAYMIANRATNRSWFGRSIGERVTNGLGALLIAFLVYVLAGWLAGR